MNFKCFFCGIRGRSNKPVRLCPGCGATFDPVSFEVSSKRDDSPIRTVEPRRAAAKRERYFPEGTYDSPASLEEQYIAVYKNAPLVFWKVLKYFFLATVCCWTLGILIMAPIAFMQGCTQNARTR